MGQYPCVVVQFWSLPQKISYNILLQKQPICGIIYSVMLWEDVVFTPFSHLKNITGLHILGHPENSAVLGRMTNFEVSLGKLSEII